MTQASSQSSKAVTLFETGILDLRYNNITYLLLNYRLPPQLAESRVSLLSLISGVFAYVVELNILIRTRQRVTNNTILAGTMSGGMKKDTY